MISITSYLSELNKASLDAYIQAYSEVGLDDLKYKSFFTSEFSPLLTFEQLQANFQAKVAADVVSMGSPAPLKGRPSPGKITGDIPKIEVGRTKNEVQLQTLRQLQNAVRGVGATGAAQGIINRILDWTFEDTKFVLDAVNSKMELLSKNITSAGKYTLNLVNNEGGVVTPVPMDFGIPAAQILNSGTDWYAANPATATPITDLKAIMVAARAKGFIPKFVTMEDATFQKLILNTEVQKFTASYIGLLTATQVAPTLGALNNALNSAGLPPIRIWDSIVNVESKAGVYTPQTGWTAGNVVLTVESQIGRIIWSTTTDDFVSPQDVAVKSHSDFTTIKTWAELNPTKLWTTASAFATPVLNNAYTTYILKTKQS